MSDLDRLWRLARQGDVTAIDDLADELNRRVDVEGLVRLQYELLIPLQKELKAKAKKVEKMWQRMDPIPGRHQYLVKEDFEVDDVLWPKGKVFVPDFQFDKAWRLRLQQGKIQRLDKSRQKNRKR